MSFVNTQYLMHIVAAIFLLFLLFYILNNKYFKWVKSYWFFERSWLSRFSSLFYMAALATMLISLLDLRGPEEKIKSSIPDQRTIIILDSSSSMLAEDVRPSRFVKALQLARHFVKNAAGHQIALVLFSDIQKRIVPFTDDVDLLDSRLAALEKTNSVSGGSNISQAITEAVRYFESEDDNSKTPGNILVLTDAEETEGGMDVELGSNINLAVIGIGTAKGSNIPLRWDDGSFRGYKTFKGEQVVTKLDENFIRKLGRKAKNYKYWIANSYSLPTEEVLSFYRKSFSKTAGKGDVKVRPVFSYLILIPAIIFYIISVLLGRFKSFKPIVMLLLLFCFIPFRVQGQEVKPKELSPLVRKSLEKMKTGKAERGEVLKIAEQLLRENQAERAAELYSEYSRSSDSEQVIFNHATSLLNAGKVEDALPLIQKTLKESNDEELKNKLRSNLLLALNNQENSKQKNQSEKDKEKDKQEEKDSKDSQKGNSQNNDNKDGDQSQPKDNKENKQGKDQKDDKQKKPSQNQDENTDKDKNKEEQKKDPKDLDKPQRDSRPQTLEEKEKMIEQKRKMVKTPAMVKQIMNDDRELQKKMMDTSTKERGEKAKRDW